MGAIRGMSKHPAATRDDHDTFCTTENWTLVRGATGQPVSHHRTYKLELPDQRVLRTRISKPVDRSDYSRGMWSTILREQLEVSNDEFWACVRDRELPARSAAPEQRKGIPYYLLRQLIDKAGFDPIDAAELSEDEAKQAIAAHWKSVAESQ